MTAIDPITTEVIAHRFNATAEEMLATLVKTAYSPNIKERRDCSTATFDIKGTVLAPHDHGADLQELQADGAGLGTCHLRSRQPATPDGLDQRISHAGEQQPELVGPPPVA